MRDSDGTVVFSIAPVLTGSSKRTVELALKHGKPVLHLARESRPEAPDQVLRRFVQDHAIKVLNVDGPRVSMGSDFYDFVEEDLEKALSEAPWNNETEKPL